MRKMGPIPKQRRTHSQDRYSGAVCMPAENLRYRLSTGHDDSRVWISSKAEVCSHHLNAV
jgi:hypothetical protein